jgi:hypothetical protein
MRMLSAAAALIVCALVGYASSGTAAQTQSTPAGITVGETVTLYFDLDKSGWNCTIADLRGDFIRCKDPEENYAFTRKSPERWYNLRLIAQITRPPRQD